MCEGSPWAGLAGWLAGWLALFGLVWSALAWLVKALGSSKAFARANGQLKLAPKHDWVSGVGVHAHIDVGLVSVGRSF